MKGDNSVRACSIRGKFPIVTERIWYGIPWFYGEGDRYIMPNLNTGLQQQMYRSNGSLRFRNRQFYLNHQPIQILSGAMHYFRVPEIYWKDRLLKIKACGLNTVETYVAWNLHEPNPGQFNFDNMLDIKKFIKTAHEVGLYVILRPGPYICSEWDFGGLPSWLLADPDMKVRSNYKAYMDAVFRFFEVLISLVKELQFIYGGPIIAVQIENEFGSYSSGTEHLSYVQAVLKQHGIKEMFLTSDGWNHFKRFGVNVAPFYRRALPTVNFKDLRAGSKAFDIIRSLDREFPLMVMEFWSGWFDHWGKQHMGSTVKSMMKTFEYIMDAKASINFYMFHGGTNFGFMAGANYFKERGYNPDVTSYDYDAPLSEAGDCTEKYHRIKFMDKVPPDTVKTAYGVLEKVSFMSWENIISYLEKDSVKSKNLFPMESIKRPDGLPFQQYGYILYRKKVSHLKDLTIQSTVRDRLQVLVNGISQGFYNWTSGSGFKVELKGVDQTLEVTLDLLVENLGRVNYDVIGSDVLNSQRKGLSGQVIKNLDVLENWTIYPLDFRTDFINRIFISEKYRPITGILQTPVLLNFELNISDDPNDTFLSMEGWGKGIVIVNGHNIGRYWEIGPQKTLFILVFEEYKTANSIKFTDKPNLG
ncbi:hypothetical protein KUTeg_006280 [Tegillarca granosa]|uniref:Beta-galactosidase n=1 Tax=Tegillarca granosa TaxID=220873 RepID=A0ABQ9FG18_TEGGR|nr:hypothetical protein KUTeg_006280 [Tegillarca granosa]